ncbi:CcdB family protein [Planctobacterium marinum]|uniref:CcdB family protein n=1 Tax=Planctobacterium marinum TaxID=1631968 RepID=UPI003CC81BD4
MIKQFTVCAYSSSLVVVLTNTVFNDVESILIAPIKSSGSRQLVQDLQIPCNIDNQHYFVDLLDIATVSKRFLKAKKNSDLSHLRDPIKAGIDLLIDGF